MNVRKRVLWSEQMGYSTIAGDWKVFSGPSLGGGAVVGGGGWVFFLKSDLAEYCATFAFVGGGIGGGGNAGTGLGRIREDSNWTRLSCDQPFSAEQLHNSAGRLTTGGVSLVVGYSATYISAFDFSGSYFTSQDVGGTTTGVGAGGITTFGFWQHLQEQHV